MSADSSKFIEITHVINPLLFWFKYKAAESADVEKIEGELERYVAESGDKLPTAEQASESYRDEKYVAVYSKSTERWVRAEIDVASANEHNELIVWAIDYGVPLKKSLDAIVLLSAELKSLCQSTEPAAIKGGIFGLSPASKRVTPVIIIFHYAFFHADNGRQCKNTKFYSRTTMWWK